MVVVSTFIIYSQQKAVIWSEDFEGDWTVNWHVDAGTWEVGTPTSGPNKAYNGAKCAATVLAGKYSEPVDTRLIRHTSFEVPAASEHPRFRFWYWFSFSAGDYGEVQIKVGSGEWQTISNRFDNQGGNAWSYGSIDLSDYAEQAVQIGFYFHSKRVDYYNSDVSTGWYIDDVSLITGSYTLSSPEDFESGFDDWSADEGTWEVGEPTAGPGKAHSGQTCAGTTLGGNYQEASDSRLISPSFIVAAASENPAIRFWHWFSFSAGDYGEIQVSTDNGATWVSVSSQFANTSSGTWTPFYIPLSSYSGTKCKIAFYFHSQRVNYYNADVSSGWYVDDINFDNIYWVKESEFQKLNIYPNPFSEKTTIQFDDTDLSGYRLSLYNISGTKVIEMKDIRSDRIELEKGSLPAGIYIIELKGAKIYRNKIIIR